MLTKCRRPTRNHLDIMTIGLNDSDVLTSITASRIAADERLMREAKSTF